MPNFPTSLDTLTNPSATDYLNSPSHAGQHSDANDILEALEAKVGINSSAVTTSHDYKLSEVTGTDKAVGKSATQALSNKEFTDPILMDQVATPANPVASKNKLYFKSNGLLYKLDSSGNEVVVGGGGAQNIAKNGNFINNSSNGYGSTPDDWTNSSANPVQGGIPALTKQNLIDALGIADGDIKGFWNLNGNFNDLSSNGYNLTASGSPTDSSDGLMAQAKAFASASSQYADNAAANCNITGSQTFFGFIYLSSDADMNLFGIRASGGGNVHGIDYETSSKGIGFYLSGLTTNASIVSDVKLQTGKWYFVCGVYDSANSKLKIWVNGIKKEVTASGSATSVVQNFAVGRWGAQAASYVNGRLQNVGVLGVALTDNQVKKLFAETMYKGLKIRRSGSDGYVEQSLSQDLVERLRGKTITLVAELSQDTTSIAQIEINDGSSTTSTVFSSTSGYKETSFQKTISATATSISIRVKAITSNGNVWVKKLRLYEGTGIAPYDHSKDDWARFPKLLQLKFPHIYSGYQYEQFRLFTNPFTQSMRASGSMTVSAYSQILSKYIYLGESLQFVHTNTFMNGGTASVANYLTLPFSIEASVVSAGNGHAVQVVNNSVQEVGVARCISKNEIEVYRYTGGNWTLVPNQTLYETITIPIDIT